MENVELSPEVRAAETPRPTPAQDPPSRRVPELSLVIPCYNEEEIVGYTAARLLSAFERAGRRLELVLVDNASSDGTGRVIRELAALHPEIVACRVETNRGYGHGVLSGLPLASAPWIGIAHADGQVDAEDVVRLYEAALVFRGHVLAKVRRRFRIDGLKRKVVSVAYNLFVRALWPRLESIDVNGCPKILPREVLTTMRLSSRDWFLDPEIMIKAHELGVRVIEFNVFGRMRGGGLSHVRWSACWEFFRHLLAYRFFGRLDPWRRELRVAATAEGPGRADGPASAPIHGAEAR